MRSPAHSRSVFPLLIGLLLGFAVGCNGGDAAPPPAAPTSGLSPGTPSASGALLAAPPQPPVDPSKLTVPGPAASPCTSDSMCINHRCNLPYGKCAFPCASDADCVRGTRCFKAVISTCQQSPPNQ